MEILVTLPLPFACLVRCAARRTMRMGEDIVSLARKAHGTKPKDDDVGTLEGASGRTV